MLGSMNTVLYKTYNKSSVHCQELASSPGWEEPGDKASQKQQYYNRISGYLKVQYSAKIMINGWLWSHITISYSTTLITWRFSL